MAGERLVRRGPGYKVQILPIISSIVLQVANEIAG